MTLRALLLGSCMWLLHWGLSGFGQGNGSQVQGKGRVLVPIAPCRIHIQSGAREVGFVIRDVRWGFRDAALARPKPGSNARAN